MQDLKFSQRWLWGLAIFLWFWSRVYWWKFTVTSKESNPEM